MKSLLAVVVALTAGCSWACSCDDVLDSFPKDGATNVPTNVVIRFINSFPGNRLSYRLTRVSDGAVIATELRDGPGTRLRSLTPVSKLEADTQYELSDGEHAAKFTTGHVEDHDTPGKPELKSAAYAFTSGGDSTCGDRRLWTLRIEGGDDATTEKEQLIILVHGQEATDPSSAIGATTFGSPTLDTALCSTNFDPPEGDSFALGLQVMDLAGNVSEVSNGRPVRASCASVPAELLALLGLLLLRRR
ncbi:MAG: hypothetical protein ACO1OB_28645 [Archangium sp.]